MIDVDIPREEIVDPPALLAGPDFPWYDRSRCRTPMQWAPGPGAGFTTGRPWLRLAPDADRRNVATQLPDPDSVLSCYRRLLAFRRGAAALERGSDDSPGVRRRGRPGLDADRPADQELLVVVSFVGEPRTLDLTAITGDGRRWASRVGTHREPAQPDAGGRIALRPDEAVILEAEPA